MARSPALPITGLGTVCAAGMGAQALANHVVEGRSALSRVSRIPAELVDARWTGTVPDNLPSDPITLGELPEPIVQELCITWAVQAAREAMDQAGVHRRLRADRIALVLGTNLESHPRPLAALADEIGRALDIEGVRLATSMACASSLAAMSLARMLLEAGDADAVVVGGSDVLTPRVVGGFAQLDLLGAAPCAPFSSSVGVALGEGAAFFVIEARVDERGPAPIASLLAEGLAADAHHETSPEPAGRGTIHAIHSALHQAGLEPAQIDLVMAHGTGTQANDAAESRALRHCFGDALSRVAVSGAKSLLGHAQGAAGALELATALLGRSAGVLPAIANFEPPARAGAPPRLVVEPTPATPRRIVVNGAGFGGAHASVVVGEPLAPPPDLSPRSRRPGLCAWAGLGWFGVGLDRLPSALVEDATDRRCVMDWRRVVRGVDLRTHDPSTRMLTAVVQVALRSARSTAGIRPHPGRAVGLFVGQRSGSPTAHARLRQEIETHGIARTKASAFARSLEVMPAGACSRHLELWGPMGLVCAEASAGLLALIWAADVLERDESLAAVVAASVNEPDDEDEAAADEGEASAALVLCPEGAIELCGAAVTGPGSSPPGDLALARACERARVTLAEIDDLHRVGPEHRRLGASAGGLVLAMAAGVLLEHEPGRTAAVVASDPGVEVAVVLRHRGRA